MKLKKLWSKGEYIMKINSKVKFLSCKIIYDNNFQEYSIEKYAMKPTNEIDKTKKYLFCPDCEQARLSYVRAKTPYFRTKKHSSHAEDCGKSVVSIQTEINPSEYSDIENILNRLVSPLNKNSSPHMTTKHKYEQKKASKYKRKSLYYLTKIDEKKLYCYYARNIKLSFVKSYQTYDYIRLYRPEENGHFLSIEVKKGFLAELPISKSNIYNIAFFGKFIIRNSFQDVYINDSKLLKIVGIN